MTQAETASFIRAYLDGDTAVGNIIPIRDVLESAITYLKEQPSLSPEDLEEAAEEYAYTNWEDSDYYEGASDGLPFDPIGHTEKCFKAGAVYDRSTVKAELLEWEKNHLDSSGRISSGELIEKIKSL